MKGRELAKEGYGDWQSKLSLNNKTLIHVVGLPRSGKSTFINKYMYMDPIVNPDAIRLALHGERYLQQAEPYVWTIARTMVEALFLAGHNTVILDSTGVSRRRRDAWKDGDWECKYLHIDTSKEECIRRAEADNDQEIMPVIEKMAAAWEPFGEDEEVINRS